MDDLKGKVVLITGGASGMGKIIARRLSNQEAKVAIFDINEDALAVTVQDTANVVGFNCDVSSTEAVINHVKKVEKTLGPVYFLVTAAALMPGRKVIDETPEGMQKLFNINYFGTYHMINAVLPSMRVRDTGRIIAFGSVAGYAPVPNMAAYCATKAAVNNLIEVLQNELIQEKSKVRAHLICPPAVDTPLVNQTLATDSPGSIKHAKESGRLSDPEKIVDSIIRGINNDQAIIFPGEAKILKLWHDLLPRLWWKTVLKFETEI